MEGIGGKGEEEWVGIWERRCLEWKKIKKREREKRAENEGNKRAETRREFSSDMDVEGSTYKNFTHYNTIFVFFLSFFIFITLNKGKKNITSLCLNRFGGAMWSFLISILGTPTIIDNNYAKNNYLNGWIYCIFILFFTYKYHLRNLISIIMPKMII